MEQIIAEQVGIAMLAAIGVHVFGYTGGNCHARELADDLAPVGVNVFLIRDDDLLNATIATIRERALNGEVENFHLPPV